MVSEFSSFAITGYIDTKAPPEVAGSITGLLYWHEGLAEWVSLTDTPPTVPRGTAFHLAAWWLNQTAESMSGHIGLTITRPDGTKVTLADVLNQNNWAAPGNGYLVQFEPVILDQIGEYQAKATLSTMGQVLDERTYAIAEVTALVEITSITISKSKLVEQDPFTISITFSNPHDYEVWVRPEFGFGLLTGEPLELLWEYISPGPGPRPGWQYILYGFKPEAVVSGWMLGEFVGGTSWVDLGIVRHMGSNMTNYIYDPDGAALTTGSYAYLKVPAKGQATTSKLWYISNSARSRTWIEWVGYGWGRYPIRHVEVYPPIDLDVCVKVESAFYPEYHPEGIGIIRYGLPEAIGKTCHYKKVNYAAFVSAVPNVVNVRSTKTPT